MGIENVRIRHKIKNNRETEKTVLLFILDLILDPITINTIRERSKPVLEDNNTIPQTRIPLIIKYLFLWRGLLLDISMLNITAIR